MRTSRWFGTTTRCESPTPFRQTRVGSERDLLPGLLKTARRNVRRHVRSVAVFEVDTVFRMRGRAARRASEGCVRDDGERRPRMGERRPAVRRVRREGGRRSADGRARHRVVARRSGRPALPSRPVSASWKASGERVGVLGEIHPAVAERFDIPGRVARGGAGGRGPHAPGEALRAGRGRATVPAGPARPRVHGRGVDAGRTGPIRARRGGRASSSARCSCSTSSRDLRCPEGTRSLAFSIDFRAADRTLTDEEADGAVAAIVERLSRDFGAQLRLRMTARIARSAA